MSDVDDVSCIIRAESGCNYASGDTAAVAVLAWMARKPRAELNGKNSAKSCSCDWETGECQGPLNCKTVAELVRLKNLSKDATHTPGPWIADGAQVHSPNFGLIAECG